MKTRIVLVALGALAALPAWAQQAPRSSSTTVLPTWQSPGEPLAAAQTTREYVPNRDVVSAVQQRLSQQGYNTTVDGNYTANLRNNVLRFQSEHGLRPTGEIDLSTIGALGINVEPVGVAPTSTAMAPAATTAQTAMVQPPAYRQILERDEFDDGPRMPNEFHARPIQNNLGVTVPTRDLQNVQVGEVPPGFQPGDPVEDLGIAHYQ